MNKVKFKGVIVGTKFIFHGTKFKKINDISTKGNELEYCQPNCISLHNNHKCVIGDEAIVELVD